MLNGTFHLFRSQLQKQIGIKIEGIAAVFERCSRRTVQLKPQVPVGLEEKITEKVIPVINKTKIQSI